MAINFTIVNPCAGNRNRIWLRPMASWRSSCYWNGCHLCEILYCFYFSIHGCCLLAENDFNVQVMAVDMSHRLGWIDESLVKRVRNILKQARLPTSAPESMTVEMFKSIMSVRLDSIIYS